MEIVRPSKEIPENFPEFKGKDTRDIAAEQAGFGNGKLNTLSNVIM